MTAAIIILAMSLGLIIPKLVVDYLGSRSMHAEVYNRSMRAKT
jgi:hypothetical protein